MRNINIYLMSDSTGETVNSVFNAVKVQFSTEIITHQHMLIKTLDQIKKITDIISENDLILYSLANKEFIDYIEEFCKLKNINCISVINPLINGLEKLGAKRNSDFVAGKQHFIDENYFKRIEAIEFAINHDDGQNIAKLNTAEVILVGVSRTSKSPTCFYLANKGIKTANIPYVNELGLPSSINNFDPKKGDPIIIGLIMNPSKLADIRLSRLRLMNATFNTDYIEIGKIEAEILNFKRLCNKQNWPIINVSTKSIEETSAQVMKILDKYDRL